MKRAAGRLLQRLEQRVGGDACSRSAGCSTITFPARVRLRVCVTNSIAAASCSILIGRSLAVSGLAFRGRSPTPAGACCIDSGSSDADRGDGHGGLRQGRKRSHRAARPALRDSQSQACASARRTATGRCPLTGRGSARRAALRAQAPSSQGASQARAARDVARLPSAPGQFGRSAAHTAGLTARNRCARSARRIRHAGGVAGAHALEEGWSWARSGPARAPRRGAVRQSRRADQPQRERGLQAPAPPRAAPARDRSRARRPGRRRWRR